MSSFLPRILLLSFIMMSLEGFASLEGIASSHDGDDLVHLHSSEAPSSSLEENSHCSHCFHQHCAGLPPRFDISFADQESDHVTSRMLMIPSNVKTPRPHHQTDSF